MYQFLKKKNNIINSRVIFYAESEFHIFKTKINNSLNKYNGVVNGAIQNSFKNWFFCVENAKFGLSIK